MWYLSPKLLAFVNLHPAMCLLFKRQGLLARPWLLWPTRRKCYVHQACSLGGFSPISASSVTRRVGSSLPMERYPLKEDHFLGTRSSAINHYERNLVSKICSQRRGLQLYANPRTALNLKPCVVIYDGVCHLCNAGVNWIIKVDKSKHISFCALQSRAAEPYLRLCGVTREDVLRRFVFIEGPGVHHQASTAALKIASHLPFPYSALSNFMVVPVSIRDYVYDYVSKRRYSWFGKSSACILPTDDVLDRFVDKLEIQERMAQEQSDEEID